MTTNNSLSQIVLNEVHNVDNHGHDVYSRDEVVKILRQIYGNVRANEGLAKPDVADIIKKTVDLVLASTREALDAIDVEDYIDLSMNHNREIEVDVNEKSLREDIMSEIDIDYDLIADIVEGDGEDNRVPDTEDRSLSNN